MTNQAELDKRPPPRPRKHATVWQLYLTWREFNAMINRHVTRLESARRGKSNYDVLLEEAILNEWLSGSAPTKRNPDRKMRYDDIFKEKMIEAASEVGPIFDWLISIRGIAEASAVKLVAQVDDPGKFATVSKLWRFSGYGTYAYWFDKRDGVMAPRDGWKWHKVKKDMLIECPGCNRVMESIKRGYTCEHCDWKTAYGDPIKLWTVTEPRPDWILKEGVRDRMVEEWHCPYNSILKAELYVIVDSFIKQRTPVYRQFYDKCKLDDRREHPEKIKVHGRWMYNDGHIDARARRKTAKLFLQHFYVKWRELEGLSVSEPWILREGTGHTNYIAPPELGEELAGE